MDIGKPVRYRFGNFEANIAESALYENGTRVPLQEKPFLFLVTLLQSEGAVVTREELSRRLWPDTHVQVNQGLNAAARKVRLALHDDAGHPQFLETLGSRGYRFIAALQPLPLNTHPREASPQEKGKTPYSLHELYLRGRHFWAKRTPAALSKSLYCFQQVLESDPYHALAYAGVADAFNILATLGTIVPREGFAKAKEAAERAVELDATLCEAHVALAWARLALDYGWAEAEELLRHAIELDPEYSFAHHCLSFVRMAIGDVPGSLEAMQRARDLEPLSLPASSILSLRHYYAREYAKGMEIAESALELDPQYPLAHVAAGLAKLGLTRHAEALEHFENSVRFSAQAPMMVAHLAHGLAVGGHPERARETLAELSEARPGHIPPAYHIALAHLALGEPLEALAWLKRACEDRFHLTLMMRSDPRMDSVRSWPEFTELCEGFRFPLAQQS